MEQRLIDANALREKWLCLQGHDFSPSNFVYSIDNAPTVDAVPVRCKNCKHHEVCKNGVNGWCNEHERPTDVTYFCAEGERKEQERE